MRWTANYWALQGPEKRAGPLIPSLDLEGGRTKRFRSLWASLGFASKFSSEAVSPWHQHQVGLDPTLAGNPT